MINRDIKKLLLSLVVLSISGIMLGSCDKEKSSNSIESNTSSTVIESSGSIESIANENSEFYPSDLFDTFSYLDVNDCVFSVTGDSLHLEEYTGSATRIKIADKVTYQNEKMAITVIEDEAFKDNNRLEAIDISASVLSIGGKAFEGCSELRGIKLSSATYSIGEDALKDCNKLEYNCSDNLMYLGNATNPYLFLAKVQNTGLTTYTINDKTKLIAEYTFSECSQLETITIPERISTVCEGLFANCIKLNTVNFASSGLQSIHEKAFYNCESLSEISLPETLSSIGESAFENCTSLESINLSDSLCFLDTNSFANCTSLIKATISTIYIGSFAFNNCTSLVEVVIEDGGYDYNIDDYAFYGCTSLSKITLGEGLYFIEAMAFGSCTSLTNIILPDSVKYVNSTAFDNCSKLTTIVLGALIEKMYVDSFEDSENVTIFCKSTVISDNWNTNWNNDRPYYLYSETEPVEAGNYWHYVNNEPAVWK